MSGHVSHQNILVRESAIAHLANKSRLLVALELQMAPQVVEVLVGGDALVAPIAPILGHAVVAKLPGQHKVL